MTKRLLLLILLILSISVADAKPLPYIIQNNSLLIDGNSYWDNGIQYLRGTDITNYTYKNYNYASLNNVYKTYFSDNDTRDILIEYDNTSISFSLQNITLPSYKPDLIKKSFSKSNKKLHFEGKDFDHNVTNSDNLIKEEYYFTKKPFPTSVWNHLTPNDTLTFEYSFNYTNLDLYINNHIWDGSPENTTDNIILKRNSEILYTIPYAFVTDSNNNFLKLQYTLTNASNSYKLKISVPLTWMDKAIYPVTIDPSLEVSGGSTTLDGTYNYDYVNLTNSSILYISSYNGTGTTGWLNLTINNNLNVDTTSSIIGTKRGYTGGNGGSGGIGEGGYGGLNGGGHGENTSCVQYNGSGGGGGAGMATIGGTGGRGNHNGQPYMGGIGGIGGAIQGNATDRTIMIGGGAGGAGELVRNDVALCGGVGGNGEQGAAAIKIIAKNIYFHGNLTLNGGDGGNVSQLSGGGGGGAASSNVLIANYTMNISSAILQSIGGIGGTSQFGEQGGNGSNGRFKFFYKTLMNDSTIVTTGSVYYQGNTLPIVINISLLPLTPTGVSNLTISMNGSDSDNDTLIPKYQWFKNGVQNISWNDRTFINYSGNYTNGDTIYVIGFYNDTYENGTSLQSNSVIIGSSNSAPTFTTLTLAPSNLKYNKNFTINASGISDDSASWRIETYWKNGSVKTFLRNSSYSSSSYINISVANPFTDGLAHSIYAVVNDSGNLTFQDNLSSSELSTTFTSNISAPTITTSTLSTSTPTVGGSVNISVLVNGIGANISSASVRVERPDATITDWAMTCDPNSETPTCYRLYTSTANIGIYYIRYINLTDDSSNTGSYTSALTFTASAASSGSSGGGGGGGSIIESVTPVPAPTVNISALLPPINFINQTDIRSGTDIERIGQCLSKDLILSSLCAGGTINIVTNPTNYWVLIGAFIGSFVLMYILAIYNEKKIAWFTDPLILGVAAILITMTFTLTGFNMFFFNYIFNDSRPLFMTASFMMWGGFVSTAGFQLMYGGQKKNKTFEFIIGTPVKQTNKWAKHEWNKILK